MQKCTLLHHTTMRTILLFLLIICLQTTQAHAQNFLLNSRDSNSALFVKSLSIDVQILGNRSVTTFTICIGNSLNRELEANLQLPLLDGVTVGRYALDIDGKMREAVPVEKTVATTVFESVQKRRIDPGLLERTEGNVFRTRVYPVPANGERTIIIAFSQQLLVNDRQQMVYHLPDTFTGKIRSFKLTVQAAKTSNMLPPAVMRSPVKPLEFISEGNIFKAHAEQQNLELSTPLTIHISTSDPAEQVLVNSKDGEQYFYFTSFIPQGIRTKILPRKIAVIWDVSLSGLYRDKPKEMALLQAYLQQFKNVQVDLFTLNNEFRLHKSFSISNGNAEVILAELRSLVYDGGTDYSAIRFGDAQETLIFTDGLSSLSTYGSLISPHPVYCISSASKADYDVLRELASSNGGKLVNLLMTSVAEATAALSSQSLQFLGIKANRQVTSYFPSRPVDVEHAFSMAGKFKGNSTFVTLQFGYGGALVFEKSIRLNANPAGSDLWDVSRLYAEKQIQQLERSYETNKALITELGKKFSLVTRNTSLLVLEDVEDYVKYGIEPPAELLEEYKELLEEKREEITGNKEDILDNAVTASSELRRWWNTSFPLKETPVKKAPVMAGNPQRSALETAAVLDSAVTLHAPPVRDRSADTESKLAGFVSGLSMNSGLQDVVVVGFSRSQQVRTDLHGTNNQQLIIVDGKVADALPAKTDIVSIEALSPKTAVSIYGATALHGALLVSTKKAGTGNDPEQATPGIDLAEQSSVMPYINELKKEKKENLYTSYLRLRDKHLLDPSFYYEVADLLIKENNALAFQVLTNLAELDYHNHEINKLLGFKLKEIGKTALQLFVFKQILTWNPQEPQSYRDYALALADAGHYQAALDTLYLALTNNYDSDILDSYEGIEETIVTEINNLVTLHGHQLITKNISRKLLHHMPVDIRVVLNWNMSDTDIDLWVTDPTGEKCFYSHNRTKIGGRISEDLTQGYGPEQFMLKKAIKGKYKIEVDYYGDNALKIAGKTTLMAEVFTNYGKPTQQRKLITLQLDKDEKEGVYVGTFTF